MPQISLRHSKQTYSNHSDNKLITHFCNQSATTPPKNPVFSGISSVFLLLKLICFFLSNRFFLFFSLFYRVSFDTLFAKFNSYKICCTQSVPIVSLHESIYLTMNNCCKFLFCKFLETVFRR